MTDLQTRGPATEAEITLLRSVDGGPVDWKKLNCGGDVREKCSRSKSVPCVLATGGFGTATLCLLGPTRVVLKVVKLQKGERASVQTTLLEVLLQQMASRGNRHIMPILQWSFLHDSEPRRSHSASRDPVEMHIIMPALAAGSNGEDCLHLADRFRLARDVQIGNIRLSHVDIVQKFASSVLDALAHMQRLRICHRDIKPQNVLYSFSEHRFLVIDFGLAVLTDKFSAMEMCGTPQYMAPEMVHAPYDPHMVDIFALGISILQMMFSPTIGYDVRRRTKTAALEKIREYLNQGLTLTRYDILDKRQIGVLCNMLEVVEKRITVREASETWSRQ